MADDAVIPPIDPKLLAEARAKGVNVTALIERALARELAAGRTEAEEQKLAAEFRAANREVLREYQDMIARDGVWNEDWRAW